MTIYGQPESSTRPSGVLIDGAGYATLPIVGRIHVAGLNESSASRKIQRLVKRYDTEAIVIVENPNKTLFVIGDVKKPGTVKLTSGQITLLRAIGSAGGFQDTANRDVVYLVRQRGTTAKLTRLSLSSRRSLRDAFYVLVPGDIVYVAPNSAKMVELGPMSTLKIIMGSLAGVSAVKAIVP
jgi:polysaccharide export outer membrane protein